MLRADVVGHVDGKDELTNKDVRDAVSAIWDAYLGDLTAWAFAIGAFALLVAVASASLLRPFSAERGLARLRPPEAAGWRAARGAAVLAIGVFVVLEPATRTTAVRPRKGTCARTSPPSGPTSTAWART